MSPRLNPLVEYPGGMGAQHRGLHTLPLLWSLWLAKAYLHSARHYACSFSSPHAHTVNHLCKAKYYRCQQSSLHVATAKKFGTDVKQQAHLVPHNSHKSGKVQ